MPRNTIDPFRTQIPDYIPENETHLYPQSGGKFYDFIPEGKNAIDIHGHTSDYDPAPSTLSEYEDVSPDAADKPNRYGPDHQSQADKDKARIDKYLAQNAINARQPEVEVESG
jgi:hypothetical protein